MTGAGPAIDVRTVRSVLALLRDALWLRLALAVTLLSVTFVFLGRWQFHRHEAKVERNTVIDANYQATPVALAQVLPDPGAVLERTQQWTPVEVSGVYEPAGQALIRNRPLAGNYGYEVVVPLRTPSGAALLVDRGWLPPGQDFVRPESVPDPPAGPVSVVVRLRPGEPGLDRDPPPGQELRIDLARLAARAGGEVYRGAYGVLESERPAPQTAPIPLPPPDQSLGTHLAYAFQWWLGAIAAWVLLAVYAVREVRTRSGRPPTQRVRGPLRTSRPKRREPTDEEWEDAATG